MAFKCSDMLTIDKTFNWLTFCDLVSVFNVTGGHYVSKLTFYYSFVLIALKLSLLVSIDKPFGWLTFCDHASFVKVTGGHYVSKLFILLCNAKTIEASIFAGNTFLGYFWPSLIWTFKFQYCPKWLIGDHIYYSKSIEDQTFVLNTLLSNFFGLVEWNGYSPSTSKNKPSQLWRYCF